ncbi:ABC transporter permease [Steroidobacter cummioxidans]|uniref:ABC transporter permease n=1 Tax=Steroidobacter cummioxidans TaxID=1803913 RepID=UPI0019D426AA|nr:ABC transporter permease [Steroidobacter cummioxidans]
MSRTSADVRKTVTAMSLRSIMSARVAKQLLLAVTTLLLLSILVFAAGELLPGNIGLALLGPFADPEAVAALNRQLGADQPALTRYLAWLAGAIRGDFGVSLQYEIPVAPLVLSALVNSLQLAALTLVLVIPLALAAGIWCGLRANSVADRCIGLFGLSLAVVPEYVTGLALALVLSVGLQWLPISAVWDENASFAVRLQHLLLPALTLAAGLFGYIARMARTGVAETVRSDYVRTAILKGLPFHQVVTRHVLRNALRPTFAVIVAQTGHLIGGLLIVETLFRYDGLGQLIYTAARTKDFPVLEAGILISGAIYIAVTTLGDNLIAAMDPRRQSVPR